MEAELKAFIGELTEASGAFIRRYFGDPSLRVETKSDATPVTEADRGAEELLRKMIGQRFPDHGIIGEEFGADRPDAEFVWVLDPVDGTKSFAAGCPLFGTLIGVLHRGIPLVGAIHQPILQWLCLGDGKETTLNGKPVRVRDTRNLDEATLLTTSFLAIRRQRPESGFDALAAQCRLARTWGDCYGYLLVASGRADIMLDPVMNPWDLLPLIPVIRGAGGMITTWEGGDPVRGSSAVAASPHLHPQVLAALAAPSSG